MSGPCLLPDGTPVAVVVFDLDGTLYVNRDLGRAIHDAACRFIGRLLDVSPDEADRKIQEEKAKLFHETGVAAPLSAACTRLGADIQELHRYFAAEIDPEPFLERDDEIVRLLEDLSRRLTLAIYTNNNRELTRRILAALGMAELFVRIYTIEDSWQPKPNPVFLESIIRELGYPVQEMLFVGDRYDIDLRLPASLGSRVLLTETTSDLFCLRRLIG